MAKQRLRGLIWAAELTIFLALSSQIIIPLPLVPLTAQTLAVGLLASLVDYQIATWSIGGYVLLGLIGLPVFAGGTSGLGVIFSPTGGFILGFFVQAWIVIAIRRQNKLSYLIVGNLVGALVQLLIGTVWLKYLSGLTWPAAFAAGLVPFLIPAILKAILASTVASAMLIKLKRTLSIH